VVLNSVLGIKILDPINGPLPSIIFPLITYYSVLYKP